MILDAIDIFEDSLRDERFTDAEIQCKGFIRSRTDAGCDNLTLLSVLHCLARALEGQEKLDEAYITRLKAKELLDQVSQLSKVN